jgi:hypothetical protein
MDETRMLSKHFSYEEGTVSQEAERAGINNTPSIAVLRKMEFTASELEKIKLVPLRGSPVLVNSFFRCLELNRLIGSKDTSQHVLGEAVDFVSPKFGTPAAICKAIIASGVSFDQLILEHTWVHISFKNPSSTNRNQVLSLLQNKQYASGLTDKLGNKL